MAILNTNYINLMDAATLPDGTKDEVVNLLAQQNPVLEDALALPCNDGMRHKTTVLTGLPTPTWTQLYKGVPASKGKFQSVVDTTGMLQAATEIDTRIVDEFQDALEKKSIRFEYAQLELEGLAQEVAKAIFYHDPATDPSKPMGFAPRFNSLSAENGKQIIDGGGTGNDLTSIWLITWDRMGSHLIYPKGTRAGVARKDRGSIPKQDAQGDTFFVYREEFMWHLGLSVRNWQYVARVANIKTSTLTDDAATGADIIELMTEAYYAHKGRRKSMGRTYWYLNTLIMKYLDYQARNVKDKNLFLTFNQQGPNAKEVLHFRGIAIRECDCILNTEDEVV